MTSKKLVIFIPSIEGYGVEKNLFIVTNFLKKYFKQITVISVSKKYKSNFKKNIFFLSPIINFSENEGRFKKYVVCFFLLFKYLLLNRNCIVISFQANLFAIIISKLLSSKIIIRLNSAPSGWSNNIIKKNIFKFLFQFADEIIVNSKSFKKSIKKKFNVNSTCIYNPLNKKEIITKSKKPAKKIYNFKRSLKIINVGRLVDQKNQIIILKAVKELIYKKKLLIELVFVGDGNFKKIYQKFINENKLQQYIKILNFKKNPFNLIKQSDLFILSSKFEGLPNVLLESITLNKFVISSDCPTGPKEILLNGTGGLLFKSNNHKDLKNKIIFYIKNKKKCNKMLFYAKKNLYRFNYYRNLKKYLNLIKKQTIV